MALFGLDSALLNYISGTVNWVAKMDRFYAQDPWPVTGYSYADDTLRHDTNLTSTVIRTTHEGWYKYVGRHMKDVTSRMIHDGVYIYLTNDTVHEACYMMDALNKGGNRKDDTVCTWWMIHGRTWRKIYEEAGYIKDNTWRMTREGRNINENWEDMKEDAWRMIK